MILSSVSSDDQVTLTIARLASEAGLSRATLYRAPELLDRFRAALEQRNRDNTTALPSLDRIGEPEAEIATSRGRESDEIRDLRAANRNMAQHIHSACSSATGNNKSQSFSLSFLNRPE